MPEDELEQIRRSLSTERIIKRAASDWTDQSGGDRVGRCTHPEHGHTSSAGGTPNLIVTDDDGWYCYSHSNGGGVFEWIAVEEGICSCKNLPLSDDQFTEALREAADRADVELTGSETPDTYEEAKEATGLSEEQKAQYALDRAIDILHDNLDSMIGDQNIRGLIKDRRPFTDDMIDEARIGYLDSQVHATLLEELSKDALQDIGFHRDNDSLHVRNRIIYPYLSDGKPVYWLGRKTEDSEMDAKYLKPHSETTVLEQPIYDHASDDARSGEPVWIVEGIQDSIALAEHGGVRAISAVATNPSSQQLNQLVSRSQDAGSAVVCFDPDEGGQGDSIDLALDLMSAGVQTSIVSLPEGEDPNDFFLNGGNFTDLDPQPAAKAIIEARGDSDALIERILDTASPGTARGERLVDAIADVTPIRKTVLRDMMEEEREYENQRGWRDPVQVRKTKGSTTEWTFVYADGSEIEMDQIAGHGVAHEFANKYASLFNYIPDLTGSEFNETVNAWLQEVQVVEVDPLSQEGLCRNTVKEKIQSSQAVPERDDLAVTGADAIVVDRDEGEVLVTKDTVESWFEDAEYSLRQAAEYLQPLMAGQTRRLRLDGLRKMWWPFDIDAIEDDGYDVPDPKPVSDTDTDYEEEEEETL